MILDGTNSKEGDNMNNIIIDRNSNIPIYIQIKKQLESMILSGELPQNHVLPPERSLSQHLGVNRTTVIKAYLELKADGLVESRVGSGTVVLSQLTKDVKASKNTYIPPVRWNQLESRVFSRQGDDAVNQLISDFTRDKMILFAAGISPYEYNDIELFRSVCDRVITKYREKTFMPSPVDGNSELKSAVKTHLKHKGIVTHNKNMMITTGSQQSIEFIARFLIEPGDVVLMEEPTYVGAIQAFESYGARIIGIPIEQDGMKMDILEGCLLKYRPKFIYTQPSFQNPSGITMSLEKRKELLGLSYMYNVPILEDDAYSELNYGNLSLPSLKSMDSNDYVIYISSFSKIVSFSLRVGFIVGAETVIGRFIRYKQNCDIQTSTLTQLIISDFLAQGHFAKHIDTIRKRYVEKRNLVAELLSAREQELGYSFNIPEGGYFIWLQLPKRVPSREFVKELSQRGVGVTCGDIFYPQYSLESNNIRLNFTYPEKQDIKKGITMLQDCIANFTVKKSVAVYGNLAGVNPFI